MGAKGRAIMHDLFNQVLGQKDLSRAGELFSLADSDIEAGLTAVLRKIGDIAAATDYLTNDNNQSVVEICITRVTSCIRETGSIETHAGALVSVLELCLLHDLCPSARGEDPPHAKIASDILSCLFLNYSKKAVMQRALPVAVRFLHAGNKDLMRNISSYLSLAAIENASILAQHLQPVIDSIVAGNRSLARILPQIYVENKDPVNAHVAGLLDQLPNCDAAETNSILQTCGLLAKEKPVLLEKHIGLLCEYLNYPATSGIILNTFGDMARVNPAPFLKYVPQLKQAAEQQPAVLGQVVTIIGAIGRMNKTEAAEAVQYLASVLKTADKQTLPTVLREIKSIVEVHPSLLQYHLAEITGLAQSAPVAARITIQQIKEISAKNGSSIQIPERRSTSSQTEGTVTVITVGNPPLSRKQDPVTMTILSSPLQGTMSLPNYKHASTSTREINRPNSVSPYGSSVTVVSTNSGIFPPHSLSHNLSRPLRNQDPMTQPLLPVAERRPVSVAPDGSLHSIAVGPGGSVHSVTMTSMPDDRIPTAAVMHGALRPMTPVTHISPVTSMSPVTSISPVASLSPLNSMAPSYMGQPHAIPFRDAVQQFCEKHLNKIKAYIDNVSARVPIPIKASLDESKHKKYCKLHFICFGQGVYCLYGQNFFTIRTRIPRIWIHILFLAIQARSQSAVSQQDPSVGNLKATWDSLKLDSGNSFVRLVTSSFPSTKDQDLLLGELKNNRYFDVFEFAAAQKHWACFLCNHPERITGLLQDGDPAIEGRLKEKKGRWKFFKRWKTRYFTLSGATITYSKKDSRKATLPISQIQSVKALRKGMRDIPKAFEIFTNNQTYVFKVKDGKNAEQWVQCLQIAVARSQRHDKVSEVDVKSLDLKPKVATSPAEQETQTKL